LFGARRQPALYLETEASAFISRILPVVGVQTIGRTVTEPTLPFVNFTGMSGVVHQHRSSPLKATSRAAPRRARWSNCFA